MKKIIKIGLVFSIFLLLVYTAQCLYISFKVNEILNESYGSYGENNMRKDIVSDDIFDMLCYRNREHREYNDIYEQNYRSFPLTLVLFNKAYSIYKYTYISAFTKSYNVPITIYWEFRNLKWIIVDKHENP